MDRDLRARWVPFIAKRSILFPLRIAREQMHIGEEVVLSRVGLPSHPEVTIDLRDFSVTPIE